MMRRFSLVVLLGCLICGTALASNDWNDAVGNWTEADVWTLAHLPTVDEEVKIRGTDAVCTLNTSTGDWGVGQRMRVYEGATLIVEDGAELLGAGWMRVGAKDAGYVEQTGGLVRLQDGKDSAKLGIGDSGGSDGHYTISGGTLTYDSGSLGQLLVGARGGTGTLTIIGSSSTIQMDSLIVADAAAASGTLEFQIGSDGVSPISLADTASLDPEGNETLAVLVLSLIDAPPAGQDILLIDGAVEGTFDTVNGNPAPQGTEVVLSYGGTDYLYTLTYSGSVALVWVPEPATLVLFGLGGLIAALRRPRKK
jgi:hypothetical protein